jgi:hypothetical protein
MTISNKYLPPQSDCGVVPASEGGGGREPVGLGPGQDRLRPAGPLHPLRLLGLRRVVGGRWASRAVESKPSRGYYQIRGQYQLCF